MKICSSCGATVADDAEICPDCGMEFESPTSASPAPPTSASASMPAPSPFGSIGNGSGFTVDFGFNASPSAAPASGAPDSGDVEPLSLQKDPFDFGASGGTVVLNPAPSVPAPVTPAVPVAAAQITLKRGGVSTPEIFTFGPGAIVGRFDPDSGPVDVDLGPLPESSYVSRHHVEFRYDAENGTWFVKDLGARNGTFWRAGGRGSFARLTGEQALQSGDEISLGNARFDFHTL